MTNTLQEWHCAACGHAAPLQAFYYLKDEEDNLWDYRCPACKTQDNAQLKIPRIDLNGQPFYVPTPKQVSMHICGVANLLWGGRAGVGKAALLSTPLPTPSGLVTMGDVRVGDEVIDERGHPCTVTWKSDPHVDETGTYRVTFDNGMSVVTGGQHEWQTYSYLERTRRRSNTPAWAAKRRSRRPSRAVPVATNQKPWTTAVLNARNAAMSEAHEFEPVQGAVRTTAQILETLHHRGRLNHAVPVSGVWDLPEARLPLHPYALGVWLGDGTTVNSQVTGIDQEVFENLDALGFHCRPYANDKSCGVHGLHTGLKDAELLGNKHIPPAYLRGSSAQRLALLQGLMDTDGSCSRQGSCEFCNTNEGLARGVFDLAASLGIKAFWKEDRAQLNGLDYGPRYRVTWTSTVPVFRLTRKLARLPKTLRDTQRYHYITNVERVDDEQCQCIEVDSPSHLYLCTEAGIPTHNSWAIRHDAYMRCLSYPGYRCLILRRNFTELRDTHLDKAAFEIPRLTGKPASWRASEYTGVFPNGSRVRFGHCENDDAVKQYLSSEFHVIYVDEGATFTQYAVSFISSRLRTKKKKALKTLLRIGSNPGAMWLYDYYIQKQVDPERDPSYDPADYEFIPAESSDNPHIDGDDYDRRLNALPSEALRKMYRDGDWLAVEGQFFTQWQPSRVVNDVRRPWHVIDRLPEYQGTPIDRVEWMRTVAVIDWGYDPEPGALLFYTILPSGRVVAIKERTFRKTIVPKVAELAVEDAEGLKVVQRIGGHDMWMSDKQVGESMAETFARAGFSMSPADTDRENGWQRLHTMLTSTVFEGDVEYPMFQVYGPGCPNLTRTIPMMQCDPKHLGDLLQKDDHWVDTARWLAMSRVGASKQAKKSEWDRFDPEVRKALLGRRSNKLGTESVRRRASA